MKFRKSKIRPKEAFIPFNYKEFTDFRNAEIQYCPHRMWIGNRTVEGAIQKMKNQEEPHMEDGNYITEGLKQTLKVLRFTIHRGLKKHRYNYNTVESRERN